MAREPDAVQETLNKLSALTTNEKHDEAAALAGELGRDHADDADLQLSLADWHQDFGTQADADGCVERAYAVAPDDLYVQRAMGMLHIRNGELDRAAEMFRCMDADGDHRHPQALIMLGEAWQERGDHDKALEAFGKTIALFPETARCDAPFRKAVLASENALAKSDTILPPGRSLFLRGAIIALLISGIAIALVFGFMRGDNKRTPVGVAPVRPELRILTALEDRLKTQPESDEILRLYLESGLKYGQLGRVRDFLKKGLSRRPAIVEWHRMYQIASEHVGAKNLVAEYDAMLKAAPDDARLFYLRGRLAEARDEAFSYYDRAIRADGEFAHPVYAKGYHYACSAEYAKARALLAKACELAPENWQWRFEFVNVRQALGESEALAKEARAALAESPTDGSSLIYLIKYLALRKDTAAIDAALATFSQALEDASPGLSAKAMPPVRFWAAYWRNDLPGMAQLLKAASVENDGRTAFVLQMLQGNYDLAGENVAWDKGGDAMTSLQLWLGLHLAGKARKAAPWMKIALERLRASSLEERIIAGFIKGDGQPVAQHLRTLTVHPSKKRLLALVLAARRPAESAALIAFAKACTYPTEYNERFEEMMLKKMMEKP
jgi:tetratricopeptide (TPR) repeat protein